MKQTIHDLATKMQAFAANIDNEVSEAVLFVEADLLKLNVDQLKNKQIDVFGKATPEYSSSWKSKKGLTNWNIYNSGKTLNSLVLNVSSNKFLITDSYKRNMDKLQARFTSNVRDLLFGIAPVNQPTAKQITSKAIADKIKAKCFK